MAIINKLVGLYETLGFEISTGLSPNHLESATEASFTYLLKDGESFTNGLGISLQEVYFLECLFDGFRPKNAFIIGNSFGWSTLAVALLNRDARVVAIDAAFEENERQGLDITDRLARAEGLDIRAVQAVSPRDVDQVAAEHLTGAIDFCFIDGLHTNQQVVLDYQAVRPHLAPNAVVLFHDVLLCDLLAGMAEIGRLVGRTPETLYVTCSGIAALYFGDDPHVLRTLGMFRGDARVKEMIGRAVHQRKHRHFYRLRRSLEKRLGRVRQATT